MMSAHCLNTWARLEINDDVSSKTGMHTGKDCMTQLMMSAFK